MIIIHGPQRTGKTLHRDLFAKHYGCRQIIDDVVCKGRAVDANDGDLLLSYESPDQLSQRFPKATLVPIAVAREAVGLEPIPAAGFPAPPRTPRPVDSILESTNSAEARS